MENISFLEELLLKEYGKDIKDKIMEGYKLRKSTFRVNSLKINHKEVEEIMSQENIIFQKVPWYDGAYIVEDEEKVRNLNIYKEGKIYFQSLSSMLPVFLLNPKEKEQILDMTASPGGKSMLMYCLSNGKSLITACEKNKIRFERMNYNLKKQGINNITTLNKDSLTLDDFFIFDKILLDAPCSGSGTILLNNQNTYKFFNQNLIHKSMSIQYELLKKAITLLKPNQEMIYSTCSILKEENEDIINKVLHENKIEVVPIDMSLYKDVPVLPSKIEGVVTVMPNRFYEGFFIAKLRKKV